MKEKDITLLSGIEEDGYWNIFIRVNENGDFNVLKGIRVRDKEDKVRHNEQSRRYAKTHKKRNVRRKGFTLLQGNEDNFHWSITTSVSEFGTLWEKGRIAIIDNNEKKAYAKLRYSKNLIHQNKRLFLKSIGEDGYTFVLAQDVSRNGNVLGIGFFILHETPEIARVRRRKRKEERLIVLNEHFQNSDLHHLSETYGIYIPTILHQSIKHDLKNGKNMNKINKKALRYLNLHNDKSKEANHFK